jgi:hypothetical protein
MKEIKVKYQNQVDEKKEWSYKAEDNFDVAINDLIIVPVGDENKFQLAKVSGINYWSSKLQSSYKLKWVVQRLDFKEYLLKLEEEEKENAVKPIW